MVVGAGLPVVAYAGAGACLGVSACVEVGARLRAVVGLAVGRAVGAARRRERPRGALGGGAFLLALPAACSSARRRWLRWLRCARRAWCAVCAACRAPL